MTYTTKYDGIEHLPPEAQDRIVALMAEVERLKADRDAEVDGCCAKEKEILRAEVARLREALEEIANIDYRGNQSQESSIARSALRWKGVK